MAMQIEIIDDNEMDLMLESDAAMSEAHSELNDEDHENGAEKSVWEFMVKGLQTLNLKQTVKFIKLATDELARLSSGERKAPATAKPHFVKARAWASWVFDRCSREGWEAFTHTSKTTGKVTEYSGAALTEDGQIVFLATGKPFNRVHANIYSSLMKNTPWYAEFEATYRPDVELVAAAPAENKVAEKERKKAEKEAEKARKEAEKAAAAELRKAESERKKAEAQAKKDEEKNRKLEEKRLKEEQKAAEAKAVLEKIKPLAVPAVLAAKAAPIAAKAAPVKVAAKAAPISALVPLAPKKPAPLEAWEKPAEGASKLFVFKGKEYARDHEDNLFEMKNGAIGEYCGRFINGEIDDSE